MMQTLNLADAHRPTVFSDVVGQEKVVSDLEAAISKGKLGSTILISGPLGCGKTTLAYMVARYLNCETGDACGECPSCQSLDAKTNPDVTFIDIGSRGKIDDIRQLLTYSHLAPRNNKRVFILDEAHALASKDAATALLTTLESPPANTVFILCTTNPEKLLPTIVSRSVHFKLGLLDDKEIGTVLRRVIKKVGMTPTTEEAKAACSQSLRLISEASAGHARDAISMLQRVVDAMSDRNDWDPERLDLYGSQAAPSDLASLLAAILSLDLTDTIVKLRSHKEPRTLMYQLRTLVHLLIGYQAKALKFQTPDMKAAVAEFRKRKTNPTTTSLIRIRQMLIQAEFVMNQGIKDEFAFESAVTSYMCDVNESKS